MKAVLAVRARLFLSYRLTVRLVQVAVPDGGARSGWWRFALVGFVILDVGQWFALRDPDRFGLRVRLVVDSLDVAFWSLAPYPTGAAPTAAVLIGVPLAAEAGLRCQLKGIVVPAAALAATVGLHVILGRSVAVFSFAWLLLALGWGILLARYIGRLQGRTNEECDMRRSAECRRALLAGENRMAMGASSVVDAIESMLPVLGPPEPGSVLWTFADAWKLELAQSTAGCAVYLGQVFAEWSADFNSHPDLSSRIEVCSAKGIGTTVLTEAQGTALRRLLCGVNLRGRVPVELDEPGVVGPPGQSLRLRVGGMLVEVPADPASPPRRYDPAPVAFLIVAGLMLADFLGYPLRPVAVVVGVSLAVGAAWWSHRRLRGRGLAARRGIVLVAGTVAVVYTIAATLSLVRLVSVGGTENYPVVAALDLLGLLGGMYWHNLNKALRSVLVTAAALVVASSWLAHATPHRPVDLLVTAAWSIPLLLSGLRLARELETGAAVYAHRRLIDDLDACNEAFLGGQRIVAELVARAVVEARQRVSTLGSTLSTEVAETLRRRLEEVDRRLTLARVGGLS